MAEQDTSLKDEGRDPGTDTAPEPAAATKGAEAPPAEESFIDPSELPEDLKPHWKRMHSAFSKAMKGNKDLREKAELVDRFQTDQQFAVATAADVLQRAGYTVQQAAQGGPAAGSTVTAPRELVAAIKSQLSPELQWMADSLANAQWASAQLTLGPYAKKQEDERQRSRSEAYEAMAEDLSEKHPGWEEHEEDMDALLKFLQSDQQTHRRFGSKLELLLRMVNPAAAIAEAQQRQAEAARSRTMTGRPARHSGPDASERIVKAKTEQEAWDIAAKEAIAELERQGVRTT